jgi:hypothetical protein
MILRGSDPGFVIHEDNGCVYIERGGVRIYFGRSSMWLFGYNGLQISLYKTRFNKIFRKTGFSTFSVKEKHVWVAG